LDNVFSPSQERFLFDDLHIVQVDKVAQQHACRKCSEEIQLEK
jgi:hypothetical protein